MSAYDDEFGLFGDEAPEEERKATLGARKIATGNETIIDEIEPEDERAPRRRRRGPEDRAEGGVRPRRSQPRAVQSDDVLVPRAVELVTFLAKRLVKHPEAVRIEVEPDDRGAVLALEVDPDDLGKVIGRGGRVAQALRTLVRAGAEGRVNLDIVDVDELEDEEDEEAAPAGEGGEAEAD